MEQQPFIEVIVPQGCAPGQQFTVSLAGQDLLIACPPGVVPGSVLEVPIPLELYQMALQQQEEMAQQMALQKQAGQAPKASGG